MTEERKQLLHPTSRLLAKAYNTLIERNEVFFAVNDEQLNNLDTIVKNVKSAYFGFVRYPTKEDQISAYFCYIIKNHPMTDGNKRLAVLWVEILCAAYEIDMHLPATMPMDKLAVSVEQAKDMNFETLVKVVKTILF